MRNTFFLFSMITVLLVITVVCPTLAGASVNANEIDVRKFTDLAAALSSPLTKDKTIVITDNQTINTATIPPDRSIRVERNGGISVNASHTLFINGPFVSVTEHIFKGSGLIRFGANTARYIYPQWWGAKGNGVDDDTAHIQAAIDSTTASDNRIYIKNGTYNIVPSNLTFDEAGPSVHVAFIMKSDMHILAESNAVFRIVDNFSTDSAPKRMHMFFSNRVLSNISFKGLTFDMNGMNNKISPERPRKYNRFTQAAIAFSGTMQGSAARANNVAIDSCSFINSAGVSSLIMTQSNSKGVAIGNNWIISNCLFKNNGLDTDDHSSIFGWADDVSCLNNTFTADVMWGTNGMAGAKVAMEIHGARHKFIKNKIINYYQGVWVASNYTSPASNIVISDNEIGPVRALGIASFRTIPTLTEVTGVIIKNNNFIIDDTPDKVELKAAVRIASEIKISRWEVVGNTMKKLGSNTTAVFGLVVSQNKAGGEHDDIEFRLNKISGAGIAFYIKSSANSGLGRIRILDNEVNDTIAQSTFKPIGVIISGVSPIQSIVSLRNKFTNRRTPLLYGHYISGPVDELNVSDNTYLNVTNAYVEASKPIIKKRSGKELPK